ncbi:MAG: hypothetical protein QW734_11285 [Candidatus Bathyarchaeia archaeon]
MNKKENRKALPDEVDEALKAVAKGKISLSLAAGKLGLTVEELINEAVKRNVKIFNVKNDVKNIIRERRSKGK